MKNIKGSSNAIDFEIMVFKTTEDKHRVLWIIHHLDIYLEDSLSEDFYWHDVIKMPEMQEILKTDHKDFVTEKEAQDYANYLYHQFILLDEKYTQVKYKVFLRDYIVDEIYCYTDHLCKEYLEKLGKKINEFITKYPEKIIAIQDEESHTFGYGKWCKYKLYDGREIEYDLFQDYDVSSINFSATDVGKISLSDG